MNLAEHYAIARQILKLLLPLAICSASAQTVGRVPIAEASVRQTIIAYLAKSGWPSDSKRDFEMRWHAMAANSSDHLNVLYARKDARCPVLDFILECQPRSACLDFWVSIKFDGAAPALTAAHSPLSRSPGQVLARAGGSARLTIAEPGMRLQLAVVCLENGRLEQKIRVLDANSHRVFWAEVSGENELRARWQ